MLPESQRSPQERLVYCSGRMTTRRARSPLNVSSWRIALAALMLLQVPIVVPAKPANQRNFVRVNQLGYLPDAPKTAIVCSLDSVVVKSFTVQDISGRVVLGPRS